MAQASPQSDLFEEPPLSALAVGNIWVDSLGLGLCLGGLQFRGMPTGELP